MPARLDNGLYDHPKVMAAAELLGGGFLGEMLVLGFFAKALMYADRHLSDGVLPRPVVRRWSHGKQAVNLAQTLVSFGLLEEIPGGYRIHDYHDWNNSRLQVLD